MTESIILVYLHPSLCGVDYSHLHRYFHSGTLRKESKPALLCKCVETANPYYLSAILLAPSNLADAKIQIPHNLVVAILDLANLDNQFGFLDSE